jgi:dTDP-4-amino-4,6-dideoxygalactose transaminase
MVLHPLRSLIIIKRLSFEMKIQFVDLKAQYQSIQKEIDDGIAQVLAQTAFILGPRLENFEKAFAAFCNASYCVGLGSGTDALYLALKAMGIGEGDEVITVSHTYIATSEAISFAGAKPVFVDIEEDTMLIDIAKIEQAITPKTKAILPVHLYGQLCDVEKILTIAKKHHLQVLEDCAQAHAAEIRGKRSPISSTSAFSFYPGKNLGAYGDAGAVVTNDVKIAEYLLQQRDHGRIQGSKYEHQYLGFGFRLDTLQAEVLNIKLKHLEKWTEQRRKNAEHYTSRLKDFVTTPVAKADRRHVYHVYPIRVNKDRDALRGYLESKEISTNVHYPIPVHLQPAYKFLNYKKGDFPITERCVEQLLSLPLYPELTESQIDFICDHVVNFVKSH